MCHIRHQQDGSPAASSRVIEGGYTFVESLLHLMIFALFFVLFAGFFRYSAGMASHVGNPAPVEWELFRYELAEYLREVDEVHVNGKGDELKIIQGGVVTDISHYKQNSIIRKQVNGKGHEPMLTGVKSASFAVTENELSVEVILEDKVERSAVHHIVSVPK